MKVRPHRYVLRVRWTGPAHGPTPSYAAYSREYLVESNGKPPLRGSADTHFAAMRPFTIPRTC